MAALLILFPERAARPTRGGGHGGAGTRSQGPSIHTSCKTYILRWKRLPSGGQFSTLEEAGEVFGNTHGKRNPVVVSVTNKIQVCCDTSTVYLHIYSTQAQMGSMCLLIWGCIFQLVLRDESKLQKSVTIFFVTVWSFLWITTCAYR